MKLERQRDALPTFDEKVQADLTDGQELEDDIIEAYNIQTIIALKLLEQRSQRPACFAGNVFCASWSKSKGPSTRRAVPRVAPSLMKTEWKNQYACMQRKQYFVSSGVMWSSYKWRRRDNVSTDCTAANVLLEM